jgi:ElaB/YqjD/DUF883 family membrane-anchored ribosome-binding protein
MEQMAVESVKYMNDLKDRVKKRTNEILSFTMDKGIEMFNNIKDRVGNFLKSTSEKIGKMAMAITDRAKNIFSFAKDVVGNMKDQLVNFTKGGIDMVTKVAKSLVSKVSPGKIAKKLMKLAILPSSMALNVSKNMKNLFQKVGYLKTFMDVPYLSTFMDAVMTFPDLFRILMATGKNPKERIASVIDFMKKFLKLDDLGAASSEFLTEKIKPTFVFLLANIPVISALIPQSSLAISAYGLYKKNYRKEPVPDSVMKPPQKITKEEMEKGVGEAM